MSKKEELHRLDNRIRVLEHSVTYQNSRINTLYKYLGTNPFRYTKKKETLPNYYMVYPGVDSGTLEHYNNMTRDMYTPQTRITEESVDIPLADVLLALCEHLGVVVEYVPEEPSRVTFVQKEGKDE